MLHSMITILEITSVARNKNKLNIIILRRRDFDNLASRESLAHILSLVRNWGSTRSKLQIVTEIASTNYGSRDLSFFNSIQTVTDNREFELSQKLRRQDLALPHDLCLAESPWSLIWQLALCQTMRLTPSQSISYCQTSLSLAEGVLFSQ